MSCVYFSSQHAESELRGSERAHLDIMTRDLSLAIVNPDGWGRRENIQSRLIKHGHRLAVPRSDDGLSQWVRDFTTSWNVEGANWMQFEGYPLDPFEISLNTATLLGSVQIKVAAWIHGQCEVHGFVEEADRAWLADVFAHGLATGVFRPGQDWEQVISHLRASDPGPVVMGYSVCHRFPNHAALTAEDVENLLLASGDDSEDSIPDLFCELPADVQWQMGLRWLRSDEANLSPFGPTTLDRTYGSTVTAFDLFDDNRLRAALANRRS